MWINLILTETNRAVAGEYHFRRAIELAGENARVAMQLKHNCLKVQPGQGERGRKPGSGTSTGA